MLQVTIVEQIRDISDERREKEKKIFPASKQIKNHLNEKKIFLFFFLKKRKEKKERMKKKKQ